MTSTVRISNGYIDRVLDTLDGQDPRKNWISDDVDKKSNSYDLLYDGIHSTTIIIIIIIIIIFIFIDFPRAIQWLPKTITFANFFHFYEMNHVWISHPFYTAMKVRHSRMYFISCV